MILINTGMRSFAYVPSLGMEAAVGGAASTRMSRRTMKLENTAMAATELNIVCEAVV